MQRSVLDINVSCFANYDTPGDPRPVNLLRWLTSARYKDSVGQIRSISDKAARDAIKATLPAITPAGLFTYRKESALVSLSGLIQFDIDEKGNEHILNYSDLKALVSRIRNIAYCGLSVSGKGYWGLVPVASPQHYSAHFKAMETAFKRFGITIDPAPKNIASLRGYSYDRDGYFNHHATVFKSLHTAPRAIIKPPKQTPYTTQGHDTRARVEALINDITAKGIDITTTYDRWVQAGFALISEFGPNGRGYFHAISSTHPKYNYQETDKKFTALLRSGSAGKCGIGTLFYLGKG